MFRKVFQNRPKRICVICGDFAIGKNFDVFTCLACKAFFRRNALSDKELPCPFTGNCQITKNTRRFCSYCRLRKCFAVGMKKEWILSDTEKIKYKEKIDANKVAKRQKILEEVKQLQTSNEQKMLNKKPSSSSSTSQNLDEKLSKEENSFERLFEKNSFDLFDSFDIDSELGENCFPEFDDILSELSLEFPSTPSTTNQLLVVPNSELSFFTSELLEQEIAFLQELLNAGSTLCNPYLRLISNNDCEYSRWSRMPQYTMHRLLRLAKGLRSFNNLISLERQSKLVKRRLTEMLAVRSTTALYDRDRQSWLLLDDITQATVFASISLIRPFCSAANYERHQALPGLFSDEWRDDRLIIDLLTVIVLFASDKEDSLSDNEYLEGEYTRYTTLLNRYLHLKYPSPEEAFQVYQQLLAYIEELQQINGDLIALFRSYSPALHKFPFFLELLQLDQNEHTFSRESGILENQKPETCANDADAFTRFSISEVLQYMSV